MYVLVRSEAAQPVVAIAVSEDIELLRQEANTNFRRDYSRDLSHQDWNVDAAFPYIYDLQTLVQYYIRDVKFLRTPKDI